MRYFRFKNTKVGSKGMEKYSNGNHKKSQMTIVTSHWTKENLSLKLSPNTKKVYIMKDQLNRKV
jgi:hypothetical protein